MNTALSKEKLLLRGFCCGLKCKNCPYYPLHSKDSTTLYDEVCSIKNPQRGMFSKLNTTSHWDWDSMPTNDLERLIIKDDDRTKG